MCCRIKGPRLTSAVVDAFFEGGWSTELLRFKAPLSLLSRDAFAPLSLCVCVCVCVSTGWKSPHTTSVIAKAVILSRAVDHRDAGLTLGFKAPDSFLSRHAPASRGSIAMISSRSCLDT